MIRSIQQGLIDFGDFAAQRAVDVGCRFHRLHYGHFLSGVHGGSELREFNEHDVAERFLSVITDADGCDAIVVNTDPFMRFSVS